jgi:hypothetical protein
MTVIDKMEWEGVPPAEDRDWYRHCFGVRCRVWAVAGCYERTYYLDPIHLGEDLRPLLANTVWGIVEIIQSELIAAIDARPTSGVLSSVWQSDARTLLKGT